MKNIEWFLQARLGLFVHFGLYSMLARGEWVMNREGIPVEEYRKLADRFNPEKFDPDFICSLAVEAGMKYIVFTTMHHEGFRMYDSSLTDYCSTKSAAKRDFVAEIISSAKKHGLKTGLYHSLNNWFDKPDAVDALEDKKQYDTFIDNTFSRIKELLTKYNPVDILWYDGWWPFNATGWQAERMNEMALSIQPQILFNGRNGLAGDFGTPEGHMSAPSPWRPWEACMTMNNNWGYHSGDNDWKSLQRIIRMLAAAASGKGNLLLNIGPMGDGFVPAESVETLKGLGKWLRVNGEAVFDTDILDFDLLSRGEHRGDWEHHGIFTASGNNLYLMAMNWMGPEYVLTGLETKVKKVSILGDAKKYHFSCNNGKMKISGLPENAPDKDCSVLKIECEAPPVIYRTGGMRIPATPHPHYDPCPSDIKI
ncbi:MAG: hypothetical protein A2020_09135 [Lentisphaerae bacterium GWF2_45_14]|nr:MAG: hypothetical protein A2020_09135 [Lentisphaerae bacterium GWF2_45_14]